MDERRYTELEKMINHLLNSCIDHLRQLGIDPTDGAVRPPHPDGHHRKAMNISNSPTKGPKT